MSELEIARNFAKQALTAPTITNNLGDILWDRAQRLVRNVEYICQLPELASSGPQIDRFCLIVATYFSDAGLAHYPGAKNTIARAALSNTNGDELLDFSTQVVEDKLAGCIDRTRIEKINRIITESGNRFTRMVEAMILSDAHNLDDMGATGIFNEFKLFVSNGKGISNALQSWKRKTDYRYWQARLKEGFRFEQVRKLAEQRLSAADYFMNQLKVETQAQDLEELIDESLEVK